MQRVCKSNISYYCTLYWIGFYQNLLTPSTLKKKCLHLNVWLAYQKKGNGLLVEMIMNFSKNFTVLGFYHLLLRGHNPFLKHACKVGLSSEINNQRSLEFISQLQNIYLKLSFV